MAVWEYGATKTVAEEADPLIKQRADTLKVDMREFWDEKLAKVPLSDIARAVQYFRVRIHRK
eukprot:8615811-Pyramimonas_sp.AAC.1